MSKQKHDTPAQRVYTGGWPEDELSQMLNLLSVSQVLRVLATMLMECENGQRERDGFETCDPRIVDALDILAKKISRELEVTDA